jgi:hypothetical protein
VIESADNTDSTFSCWHCNVRVIDTLFGLAELLQRFRKTLLTPLLEIKRELDITLSNETGRYKVDYSYDNFHQLVSSLFLILLVILTL